MRLSLSDQVLSSQFLCETTRPLLCPLGCRCQQPSFTLKGDWCSVSLSAVALITAQEKKKKKKKEVTATAETAAMKPLYKVRQREHADHSDFETFTQAKKAEGGSRKSTRYTIWHTHTHTCASALACCLFSLEYGNMVDTWNMSSWPWYTV